MLQKLEQIRRKYSNKFYLAVYLNLTPVINKFALFKEAIVECNKFAL